MDDRGEDEEVDDRGDDEEVDERGDDDEEEGEEDQVYEIIEDIASSSEPPI